MGKNGKIATVKCIGNGKKCWRVCCNDHSHEVASHSDSDSMTYKPAEYSYHGRDGIKHLKRKERGMTVFCGESRPLYRCEECHKNKGDRRRLLHKPRRYKRSLIQRLLEA